MKKYVVRYSVPGFEEKEEFTNKEEALKKYDWIIDNLGYWTERDIYEVEV